MYGNLFMAPHRGARMPSENAKGKRVDGNLFYSGSDVKDRSPSLAGMSIRLLPIRCLSIRRMRGLSRSGRFARV